MKYIFVRRSEEEVGAQPPPPTSDDEQKMILSLWSKNYPVIANKTTT